MPARIPTQVASKRGACRRTEQGDDADRVRNGAGDRSGSGSFVRRAGGAERGGAAGVRLVFGETGVGWLCLLVSPEALTLADGLLIAAADSDS